MQLFNARIARITQATPTIKAFELEVTDHGFKYLPGQWIEVSTEIDGETKTSGYSVTTSPGQHSLVGLAIKSSATHPVTRWLHQAKEGDIVQISRGQGPFVFVPDMGEDIVLIGGGVGVTPLLSIWRYVRDACPETHATLYYSVSHPDEILFREELEQSARKYTHVSLEITVTQPSPDWHGQSGRINRHKIAALNAPPNTLFYLCGPPGMVDDMEKFLRELGVPASRIIFEKWW
ncbi:MAG: FAD-dependent oxidoreductase [Hydrogenophilaceae bacterium]|nr:FAD-dependent oxidoreductase [Hydrogenophilaceae bacterium]